MSSGLPGKEMSEVHVESETYLGEVDPLLKELGLGLAAGGIV